MVTKRIRSEYTKKFKDPKWESYSRCYEELLKYRRTRRLLEQSHNPWFWGECASDTTESGTSTPQRNNKVEPLPLEDQVPPTCENVPEPEKEPKAVENQEGPAPCESPDRDGSVCLADPEVTEPGEGDRNLRASPAAPAEVEPEVSAKSKSRQLAGTFRKSTRPKSQPRKGQDTKETKDSKENKHPFALYGWGERQADMASKKTHNVCPAASTKEIHESALRAKTRREVEKQMKKMDKRRTRSADIDKIAKSKIVPDFDPWMTEYMRCFSVRSR